jgi:AcrR family transcriptional regulator
LSKASDGKKQKLLRPRSRRAHSKVLDAAIELFADRGIEGTSIDSIAARSGVSKATIYKHWPDKDALCLEALDRIHGLDRERPAFDSGDLKQDLTDFLNHKPPEELSELRDRLMPHLIAYAARNQEFGRAWRSRIMEPGRAKAIELMQRGIAEGQFPADLDMSLGLALLIGPMMYKHISRNITSVPQNLADGVARAFWRAFAISERGPASKKETSAGREKVTPRH